MSIARMVSISDGVFSIAITLLVFNIRVPDVGQADRSHQLWRALLGMFPALVSYVLSFAMIGVYWVGHHNIFHHIRRSNRILLWLNLLFLMCVAFVPFPAAMLGRYPRERTVLIIYGATLVATGVALQLIWWYSRTHRMITAELNRYMVRQASLKILTIPALCLISIALSFYGPRASLALYILVPFFYVLPTRLDLHWMRYADKEAADVPPDCVELSKRAARPEESEPALSAAP